MSSPKKYLSIGTSKYEIARVSKIDHKTLIRFLFTDQLTSLSIKKTRAIK